MTYTPVSSARRPAEGDILIRNGSPESGGESMPTELSHACHGGVRELCRCSSVVVVMNDLDIAEVFFCVGSKPKRRRRRGSKLD